MATKTGLPTTKEEVLLILINRKTPQAYNENAEACSYLHSNNGGCAIGQCVTKHQAEIFEGKEGNYSVTQLENRGVLPKRLLNLDVEFLNRVQNIHDEDDNWIDKDITDVVIHTHKYIWSNRGICSINDLIKEYNLDLELLIEQ